MTLNCLATGSSGNSYILTNNDGKHLILDAGIPVAEIKKGLNFDIENVEGCLISHEHHDHSLSLYKIRTMGIPIFAPYKLEKKRVRCMLGDFQIESFDVPHNGCENRAFLLNVDNTTLLYATDFEYIPYDLTKKSINVMLIELNYQKDRIDGNDHMTHIVMGHAEEQTTIDVIKNNIKHLRRVVLCHMSQSGALNREIAMKNIRATIPEYIGVDWAKPGTEYNLDVCPF